MRTPTFPGLAWRPVQLRPVLRSLRPGERAVGWAAVVTDYSTSRALLGAALIANPATSFFGMVVLSQAQQLAVLTTERLLVVRNRRPGRRAGIEPPTLLFDWPLDALTTTATRRGAAWSRHLQYTVLVAGDPKRHTLKFATRRPRPAHRRLLQGLELLADEPTARRD